MTHVLESSSFVRIVFHDDIGFRVLVVSETDQNNILMIFEHFWVNFNQPWVLIHCRFRSLPRMWASRLVPSKHMASRRPFPNIFKTWNSFWKLSLLKKILPGHTPGLLLLRSALAWLLRSRSFLDVDSFLPFLYSWAWLLNLNQKKLELKKKECKYWTWKGEEQTQGLEI